MKKSQGQYVLKDGSRVFDLRLSRIPAFDERSKQFRVSAGITQPPVSKKWECTLPALDQGVEGACAGYAATQVLRAAPIPHPDLDGDFAKRTLYWRAQQIDDWEGGSYPGAVPFYEGTSVLAVAKVALSLGLIDTYRWAFGIDDVLQGLSFRGPVLLGISWFEYMNSPNQYGYVVPTGKLFGGHAIMGNEVNMEEEYVTLLNSWGPSWGNNGSCKITFKNLEKLLRRRGEAVFFHKK